MESDKVRDSDIRGGCFKLVVRLVVLGGSCMVSEL